MRLTKKQMEALKKAIHRQRRGLQKHFKTRGHGWDLVFSQISNAIVSDILGDSIFTSIFAGLLKPKDPWHLAFKGGTDKWVGALVIRKKGRKK